MPHRSARTFRTTSIIALPLALMAIAPAAHALQMDAGANWQFNSVAAGTDSAGPASSGSVDIIGWDSDASNTANSIFYHTYGDASGNFGSRTSGSGNFDITGNYSFNESYVASGGAATFNFHIVPGELAFYNSATLTGLDQLIADYTLDIRLNGVSIWNSSAQLTQNSSGTSLSQTGASLGGTLAGNQYSWMDYFGTVALGTFATGQNFTIDYDLTTHASGNLTCTGSTGNSGGGATDPTGGDGKPGAGGNEVINLCGGAIARIGDPFGVEGSNSTKITGASAVPEPGTVALLGLGLAGFGIVRRRRR